jgi:hypothetical protein
MDLKMKSMKTLYGENLQHKYFHKFRKSLNQGAVNGNFGVNFGDV